MQDHVFRRIFSVLSGCTLRGLGVTSPPLRRELSPVVPRVDSAADELDVLREAEDGSVWHVEFESGGGDARACAVRLMRHHLAAVARYRDRAVHSVVLWARGRGPAQPLVVGQARFAPEQVFLRTLDGGRQLAVMLGDVAAGRPLARDDLLPLSMLPLMHHTEPMWELLGRIRRVVEGIEPELRRPMMEIVAALAYHRVQPQERVRIREALEGMPFAQELYEDLRREAMEKGLQEGLQQGLQQGRQQALREDLLDIFSARFGKVPTEVRQMVQHTKDVDTLKRWLRAVARAADGDAARLAVVGGV